MTLYTKPSHGMLGWYGRSGLWAVLLPLHLSDVEMDGLYASLAPTGHGHGLNSFAVRLYGKPLSSLTKEQTATVVAVTRAPSIYKRSPERLAARRDFLLSRVQDEP